MLWIILISGVVLMVPLGAWNAFVTMKLWGWFIVPLGVEPIPFVLAWGIGLFVFHMVYHPPEQTEQTSDEMLKDLCETCSNAIVYPGAVLIVGYIISCFM